MSITVRPLSREESNDLQAWRSVALERMPYMARILFALRPVSAPGLGTFGVDEGLRLYIDFAAVRDRGITYCAESLLHEASHVLQQHPEAAKECSVIDSQRQIFNVAADCAINDDLIEAGCTSFSTGVDPTPDNIGAPANQTPHFYFHHLVSKVAPPPDPAPNGAGGGGDGGPSTADEGSGQPAPFKGCGSGSGGEPAPCEMGAGDDLGGEAPAASDAEKATISVAVAADVRDFVAKGRGSVPAGMSALVEQTFAPSKMPWQRVLRTMIQRGLRSRMGYFDTDSRRPHRRRRASPTLNAAGQEVGQFVMPSMCEPVPAVELIRDTSGSMSMADLTAVVREVEAIAKKLGIRGRDLTVTDVDAQVHASRAYTGAESIAEVTGRGGTNMVVGIEAAWKRRRDQPSVVVVATDGLTDWPAARGPVPVVAAIITDPGAFDQIAARVPSFITAVHVEPESV